MEEPENGIHPANLEAMNRLLHGIAVYADEPVGTDNSLRQVIVATHSPHFVQLQDKEDLVLAKPGMARTNSGELAERLLQCDPYHGTWRCSSDRDGMSLLSLQPYLLPPEDAQIALPRKFWGVTAVIRFLLVCEGSSDTPLASHILRLLETLGRRGVGFDTSTRGHSLLDKVRNGLGNWRHIMTCCLCIVTPTTPGRNQGIAKSPRPSRTPGSPALG